MKSFFFFSLLRLSWHHFDSFSIDHRFDLIQFDLWFDLIKCNWCSQAFNHIRVAICTLIACMVLQNVQFNNVSYVPRYMQYQCLIYSHVIRLSRSEEVYFIFIFVGTRVPYAQINYSLLPAFFINLACESFILYWKFIWIYCVYCVVTRYVSSLPQ